MGKRFQPHFRKFHDKKTTGHPQYIYDEEGNKYKVLGVTSAEMTNGVLNIKLEVNPEPNNKTPAYIRPKTSTVKKGVQNEKLKGWKFAGVDKPKVQKVIEGDKKKNT